jgi:maltose/moltooligosaccharide transporter
MLPPLYIGAGILMIMDASFNIAMEPFRALVADLLPSEQRTLGFSIQTFLIGLGAVVGSWLPYIFAELMNVEKTAAAGSVPFNVTLSFYVGAVVFLISILITVITTKEFPPDEYKKEDYAKEGGGKKGLAQIISDFAGMPKTMKQLGLVQFFSWFALFSMWVFTTPALAVHVYGVQPATGWVSSLVCTTVCLPSTRFSYLPLRFASAARPLTLYRSRPVALVCSPFILFIIHTCCSFPWWVWAWPGPAF